MDLGTQPIAVPPPPGFRKVVGKIGYVEQIGKLTSPNGHPVSKVTGRTSSQTSGLKFETKVKNRLATHFGAAFSPNPRFRFSDDNGTRVCEMDGLVLHKNYILLFEVKAQHTPDAWHQVRELYEPVAKAFFQRVVVPVEVVRAYDGYTPFPEATFLMFSLANLDDWVANFPNSAERFGVLLWPK